jgi:hypothetical protein
MKTILAKDIVAGNFIIAHTIVNIKVPTYGVWSNYYKAFAAMEFGKGDLHSYFYFPSKPTPLSFVDAHKLLESHRAGGKWTASDIDVRVMEDIEPPVLIRGLVSDIQETEDDTGENLIAVYGSFTSIDDRTFPKLNLKPDTKIFLL